MKMDESGAVSIVLELPENLRPHEAGRLAAAKVVDAVDAAEGIPPADMVWRISMQIMGMIANKGNWHIVKDCDSDEEILVIWVGPENPWLVAQKIVELSQMCGQPP